MLCGGEAVNGQESAADQRFKNEQENKKVRRFEETQIEAKQGDASAQHNLGWMYRKGEGVLKDDVQAAIWFQEAAEQGHAIAQTMLSEIYYYGRGVREDYAEAAKWFQKDAERGDPRAQYMLGGLYFKGEGVPKNYVESYAWLRLAEANGSEKAREAISNLETYLTAEQMEKGQARAAKWFRKWAEQGYESLQYSLGYMYAKGEGVTKDEVEAYAWFLLAKANGVEVSEMISNLEKRLTAEQVEKGQARALELHRLIKERKENH